MRSTIIFLPTALMMNSETPTAGLLAVIIIIPSLFALILVAALTITIIIFVRKKWNINQSQGNQDQVYYNSIVDPPLLPIKIAKNMSYEGRLEPQWRIANTEVDYDDESVQPVDKICDNSDSDTSSLHHQHSVPVNVTTINENTAYGTNVATAPEIRAEENVAYN